ncbi:hypothetical protein FOMPIDRAFT_1020824 [Fomitopsis schrenkii]|uniref:Uncharacterized protein n=1 Tax=Fomitopsis schrenkii TaxID=2126942 RepID=S8DHA0_FOMSC|nr:hypothetical protein FOMPIDRAFT_1020824 [Fomitopsis schrenkii]
MALSHVGQAIQTAQHPASFTGKHISPPARLLPMEDRNEQGCRGSTAHPLVPHSVAQQARENTFNHKHAITEQDWIREGFAIPVLPLDRYQGKLHGLLENFLEHIQASFEIVVKCICSLWISDLLYQQLHALHNPEYYTMYIAYINCLTAKPQADFTRVIAALVEEMPSAMETKAVDRVIFDNAISMETWQNGTRVKIENESAALWQIKEARQDMEEAQQLLLKRKQPAEDEDGQDDSSSTSGLMQDSAGGTGGTSTVTQGTEGGSSSSAQNKSGSALDTAGRTKGVTQGAADSNILLAPPPGSSRPHCSVHTVSTMELSHEEISELRELLPTLSGLGPALQHPKTRLSAYQLQTDTALALCSRNNHVEEIEPLNVTLASLVHAPPTDTVAAQGYLAEGHSLEVASRHTQISELHRVRYLRPEEHTQTRQTRTMETPAHDALSGSGAPSPMPPIMQSSLPSNSFKAVPRDADTWGAVQDASLVSLVSRSAPLTSPTTITMPPPKPPNQLSQLSELASLCLPLPPSHPATSDGTTVKLL